MGGVLEIRGLSKRFGRTLAVDGLDLEVPPGEVLGYLGPNGSGKTTTLRCVLGLLHPDAGSVSVAGVDALRDPARAHRQLAYVPGDGTTLWPQLTGAETLELLGRIGPAPDRRYRDELVQRFELDLHRKVRTYSTGNRRKVALVAALATRADLLLLDEPTAGLDPLREVEFQHAVREARDRGQAVLLSSHVLSEVEAVCDRVAILRQGRLVDVGTLAALRHLHAMVVEAVFPGMPPDLRSVPGVSDVHQDGGTVRLRVSGSMGPVLAALAGAERVVSREPSLEELFLVHYGRSEPAPAGAASR